MCSFRLYDMIAKQTTDPRSVETALYRSARISWREYGDVSAAARKLNDLLARFPSGAFVLDAEDLQNQMVRPNDLAA